MKFNSSFPVLQYTEIRNEYSTFFALAFILFHMDVNYKAYWIDLNRNPQKEAG